MKKISIITPCYNEESNVRECYEAVKAVVTQSLPQYTYEHIFADNASTDATLAHLKELAAKDKNVKVISNNKQGQYSILNKVNHFFQILRKAEEVSLEENSRKKNIK